MDLHIITSGQVAMGVDMAEPEKTGVVEIEKEMGITHKEFFRKLPRVLDGGTYQIHNQTVSFEFNSRNIEIALGDEQVRELSRTTRLPFTRITIRFLDHQPGEIEQFIKHFNMRFIKGGG
jgi:hypothetical protein